MAEKLGDKLFSVLNAYGEMEATEVMSTLSAMIVIALRQVEGDERRLLVEHHCEFIKKHVLAN